MYDLDVILVLCFENYLFVDIVNLYVFCVGIMLVSDVVLVNGE